MLYIRDGYIVEQQCFQRSATEEEIENGLQSPVDGYRCTRYKIDTRNGLLIEVK